MIAEWIREKYAPDILSKMEPRALATIMLQEDPEYQTWRNERGNELCHRIYELETQINQFTEEQNQLEKEFNGYFNQSIQRLMPVAEQDLQDYLDEYIRKGIKGDFGHGQVSEKAGDH